MQQAAGVSRFTTSELFVRQVAEHLELYAAIKGYSRTDAQHIAKAAAADVGTHT